MGPVKENPKQSSHHPRSAPEKVKQELRDKYYKQQNRKVKTSPTLDPSVDLSFDEFVAFSEYLKSSTRILALFGAGLSAAQGFPPSTALAVSKRDLSLEWQFTRGIRL